MPTYKKKPCESAKTETSCGKRVRMKKVAIVGVGLIGGSIGLALKKRNLAEEVVGIGRRQESIDKALSLGAVDRATLDFREGVKDANLAIVATPVDIVPEMVKRMLSHLPQGAIITDVGSTKEQIVKEHEESSG